MADWLRHLLGLRCLRMVVSHDFHPLTWDRCCGYIPEPKPYRDRCMLPKRCHPDLAASRPHR
jgi:hypothetical protein